VIEIFNLYIPSFIRFFSFSFPATIIGTVPVSHGGVLLSAPLHAILITPFDECTYMCTG
jgi:hypothetical protein